MTPSASRDPGALELDVLETEVVEETAPLAEEHRDEVDLHLVEQSPNRPGSRDD